LNSTTFMPALVIANPPYSRPANGVPRAAISRTVGTSTVRIASSTKSAGSQGSGL
jgi:hypothetical protein